MSFFKKLIDSFRRIPTVKYSDDIEPDLAFPVSQLATKNQCDSVEFQYWSSILKDDINSRWRKEQQTYNRKIWEWVYILQTLKANKLLDRHIKGLAFGVGREPLVAAIAKFGCNLLATDLNEEAAVKSGWNNLGQYSFDLDDLNRYEICGKEAFSKRVTYRHMDMNHIDPGLTGFDFLYSCCALEHLGSLKQGLDFIENSLNCIKPGGIAVHTTEFNVSSDHETIEEGPTVLFRKKDILSLASKLKKKNCNLVINLSTGSDKIDAQYDVPPYLERGPHLKLLMDKFIITSIGLILHKKDLV